MNEIQMITLRDILRQQSLTERQIEDAFLLLRYKPERVQQIFYYAAQGWTQADIAAVIGTSQRTVHHYINNSMTDIRLYFQELAGA